MKVRLESNFNSIFLKKALSQKDKISLVDDGGFGLVTSNIFNKESSLYANEYDVIIIMLDTSFLVELEVFNDPFSCNIDKEHKKIESVVNDILILVDTYHQTKPNVPICLFSFPNQVNTPFNYLETNTKNWSTNKLINDLNHELAKNISSNANTYLFDINNVILNYGYKTLFDNRMHYLAKSPFSSEGVNHFASEIESFLSIMINAPKKVLVLDLDNTLWGGVIGEEGLMGIELSSDGYGKAFYDFQKEILNLKKRGILLALCSKNNENDAKEVFDEHPDMVLSWEDFIVKKINWNDKASNIKEIAAELNLGIDSIVFIDDNPAERQWVKSKLPEVFVADFPDEAADLMSFLLSLRVFNTFFITEDDFSKTQKYQTENLRKELKEKSLTYEDFLISMEIRCSVKEVDEAEIKRVTQLLGKTNQFNFTTKRYSENAVNEFMNRPDSSVFSLRVTDKFGDYGLVGVAILLRDVDKVVLDTFLLSCRVLGKKVEEFFLAYLSDYAFNEWESNEIEIEYQTTGKNTQVEDFLEDKKCKFVGENHGVKIYKLENNKIHFPNHIKI